MRAESNRSRLRDMLERDRLYTQTHFFVCLHGLDRCYCGILLEPGALLDANPHVFSLSVRDLLHYTKPAGKLHRRSSKNTTV